jgi:hypothetical protein
LKGGAALYPPGTVTQVTSKKAQTEVIYIRAKFSRSASRATSDTAIHRPGRGFARLHKLPGSQLSEEISWPYNRPFPFHRFLLRCTQRNFPFGAGVVLINSDAVGNLKVAVGRAIEASCIAGTRKLLRWEFADRAKEGHGQAASEAHPSPAASVCPTWKDQHDS